MTKEVPTPAAAGEHPSALAEDTTVVVWVHEGPVCVRVEQSPPQGRCHACQCTACRVHQPDAAFLYF